MPLQCHESLTELSGYCRYPVLHSMHLYGGLGIFSLYVAYDTQQIIADYEEGNRDVMHGAVNLFINFKAMFTRFLYIFMGSSND